MSVHPEKLDRQKFNETLNSFKTEIKSHPNIFLKSLQKMMLTWGHLYRLITVQGLSEEDAAAQLAKQLDEDGNPLVTLNEAVQITKMFTTIDWSKEKTEKEDVEPKSNSKQRQRGGAIDLQTAQDAVKSVVTNPTAIAGTAVAGTVGFFAYTDAGKAMWKKLRDKLRKDSPYMFELLADVEDAITVSAQQPLVPQRFAYGKDQDLLALEFTPDELVGRAISTATTIDRVTDIAASRLGYWALEDNFPIAFFVGPVPGRLILPLLLGLLELIRILLSILPDSWFNYINPVFSVLMAFFELSRGDWKHAWLTMHGAMKTNFWSSMRWKMILNSLSLVSPDTKYQALALMLDTPREFFRGFMFWLFLQVCPKLKTISKYRDLLYILNGTPLTGIHHLEISDFYRIRSILLNSPILCFTPVHVWLQSMTKVVAPWDSFFLPLQAIKNTIGAPRMAEPETFESKCSETAPNRFYRILIRLIDNKDRISVLLPDGLHDLWERLIPYLEKIDHPQSILKDNKITLHEVFQPILNIKGPLRQYFDNEFLEKTQEFVSSNDLDGWGEWIYRYNKSFIINTRAAVKLMDPLVINDVKHVVKEYVPLVHDVGKIAMKKELPKVANEALAVLTHIVDPFDVFVNNGLTLEAVMGPVIKDPALLKIMNPRFKLELEQIIKQKSENELEKINKFSEWISAYPKKRIFGEDTDSLSSALRKLAEKGKQIQVEAPRVMKEFEKLPIMKKVTKAIEDYKIPAKDSEFKMPSQPASDSVKTPSKRSLSSQSRKKRSQVRGRTRKNRL
jgi:hypothetical protein